MVCHWRGIYSAAHVHYLLAHVIGMETVFRALRPFFWLAVGLYLGGFAAYSFAGDRYLYGGATEGSKDNALDRCLSYTASSFPAEWLGTPCAYSTPVCPPTQDGGGCMESARYSYYPYNNRSQDPTWYGGGSVTYSYCPDATPQWTGTKCVKPEEVCDGKAIGTSSISAVLTGEPKGNQVCINNCVYTGSKVLCAPTMSGGTTSGGDSVSLAKVCEISGPFTANKRSCDASVNGEPNIAKPYAMPPKPWYDNGKGIADCAASGGYWGTVGETQLCVRGSETKPGAGSGAGTSGTVSDSKTKTESTSDGGSKTTDTKTETTCNDGKCSTTTTTTTTITNSDGTKTTSSDTKTEDTSQTPFCLANPSNSLCAKNTFGGDCGSGFSCSGDSVQCALAKVAHETRCASKWLTTPGDPSTSTAKVEEKKLANTFTWSSMGESGTCPPDKHITSIGGLSIDFRYSQYCDVMGMIRPFVILCAWIAAAYIVFGYGQRSSE